MSSTLTHSDIRWFHTDRLGIVFSVFCAIHCAVTPILLLLAPAFGGVWSHPASHWLVALVVIPLASVSIFQGFSKHQKKWIPICGVSGILLILVGAGLPYLERSSLAVDSDQPVAQSASEEEVFVDAVGQDEIEPAAGAAMEGSTDEEVFVYVVGQDEVGTGTDSASEASCADSCCPTLVTDEGGNTRLHVPVASIVTTLGGLVLILTHTANLCCCTVCRSGRSSNHA